MANEKEQAKKPKENNEITKKTTMKRRTLLKTLAGVPVFGAFAFELMKKKAYDQEKKNTVIKELGLESPVKRYRTYEELLDDKDIDAIMIATPDHNHAPIVIAAAKAGKHIYCEKAPCHTEQQMNDVYNTVKGSKIVYQLGHQVPQSVIFQQAKEIIKKDILGKITLVESTTNRNTGLNGWGWHRKCRLILNVITIGQNTLIMTLA
jgi:hypothetical protein